QGVMKTLMRDGRDRRSENPRNATRAKNACFWLGPISGSHQGQQPQRLHSKAEYMAAPERFAKRSDSFPLHRGRRPYMALCNLGPRMAQLAENAPAKMEAIKSRFALELKANNRTSDIDDRGHPPRGHLWAPSLPDECAGSA